MKKVENKQKEARDGSEVLKALSFYYFHESHKINSFQIFSGKSSFFGGRKSCRKKFSWE